MHFGDDAVHVLYLGAKLFDCGFFVVCVAFARGSFWRCPDDDFRLGFDDCVFVHFSCNSSQSVVSSQTQSKDFQSVREKFAAQIFFFFLSFFFFKGIS
jgi:hypothetical protein